MKPGLTPCGRPTEHGWHLPDYEVTLPNGTTKMLFQVCNGRIRKTGKPEGPSKTEKE